MEENLKTSETCITHDEEHLKGSEKCLETSEK